jgi:hypothetical protein
MAGQRAGGAEDVPDAVQQPTPAAQRPRIGQMPDRLLTSARGPACKRLNARRASLTRSLVLRSPAGACQCPRPSARPRNPPVQQAGDAGDVPYLRRTRQPTSSCSWQPAAVAPQQVAVDGGRRQALGGMGVPFGLVERLGERWGAAPPGRAGWGQVGEAAGQPGQDACGQRGARAG